MRVVIVHNRYRSSSPSGENDVVENDIDHLRRDGVEVVPYIRDSDEIAGFTRVGAAAVAARPVFSPGDAIAFRRLLRDVRPDVVHLHNPFPLISPWIVRTAKAQRIPVVQTVHNYRHVCANGIHFRDGHACTDCTGRTMPWPAVWHGCYQGSRLRSAPMAAAIAAHRGTWDLVDRFLPVGPAVADHLRRLGIEDERIEVRPNAVDDPGPPGPLGEGVLFAGRLSAEKGVEPLLEAWRCSGVGRDHTLKIAGDGELRAAVEAVAQADPSVRYVGHLTSTQLDDAYRSCALVVLPSMWPETDGIAAVTAWAHGRPVLATALGSMVTSLDPDSGWLVEASVAGLVRGLRGALLDANQLVTRGHAARRQYEATRQPGARTTLVPMYERLLAVPRGSLLVVGPDGSGKSAVVNGLCSAARAAGVRVAVDHLPRRHLVHGPRRLPGPVESPQEQRAPATASALIRTARLRLDFLTGWLGPWRRAVRGGLLLLEGPWPNQAVDPARYRLPPRLVALVALLGRVLPCADRAVLVVDADEVHLRNPEIGASEVHRQQGRWRRLLRHVARRVTCVDAVGTVPEQAVDDVIRWARPRASAAIVPLWAKPLGFPAGIDLHATTTPFAAAATTIYEAPRWPADVVARSGVALARAGGRLQAQPPPLPLAAILAEIGVHADGAAAMRSSSPGRWVVGVERAGQLAHVIKTGPAPDQALVNEAAFLARLERAPTSWKVPMLRFRGTVECWQVLVTDACATWTRGRPMSLEEAVAIADDLVGGVAGEPMVHGDLVPWNVRRDSSGRLILLGWEAAQLGHRPLWDLAHFVVQQGIRCGRWTPPAAAATLVGLHSPGARHLQRVGAAGDARDLLRDYLVSLPPPVHPRAALYRATLAALIE